MTAVSLPAEPAAFPVLVGELLASYQELRGYLQGRLRNRDDAADIAQSSFAQAYAHVLNQPVANARALLFQAARHLCIDQYRRAGVEQSALEAWLLAQDPLSPSAEQVVQARQELARLMRRIERMPRLRRDVFVCVRLHGQTHREVCAALGLSAKAVELHMARAIYDLSEVILAHRHEAP